MKKSQRFQYTIRNIPPKMDQVLRGKSRREGRSLNEVTLEALAYGAGIGTETMRFHDLDSLAGTWNEDPEFDAALKAQDIVDPSLWK